MNWLDTVLLTIVIASMLISLRRGFIKEVLSLITWVAAIWVSITFSPSLSFILKEDITNDPARNWIACIILFVATVFVGSMVNYVISNVIRKTPFSGSDRLIGSIFGFLRGVLIGSVLVFALGITDFVAPPTWHASKIVPFFKVLSDKLSLYLPETLRMNKDNVDKSKAQDKAASNNAKEITTLEAFIQEEIKTELQQQVGKQLKKQTTKQVSNNPLSSS